MSNGLTPIYTPSGGVIGYSIYRGVSDTQCEWMVKAPGEEPVRESKSFIGPCDHAEEPCVIYNTYQDSWYRGTCCRKCMTIIDGTDPNDVCWGQSWEPETRPYSPKEKHEGRPFGAPTESAV